ncbi:unnamed protein product [Acanthosepion pharaonis]|uniref:Uncharacterized protein n=1 Tax=Acanthosepion pharaonis TaxID=158019 RepID=A0A812AK60_ACAPH|nr:unnamed protein product [Sepia pharaonis]
MFFTFAVEKLLNVLYFCCRETVECSLLLLSFSFSLSLGVPQFLSSLLSLFVSPLTLSLSLSGIWSPFVSVPSPGMWSLFPSLSLSLSLASRPHEPLSLWHLLAFSLYVFLFLTSGRLWSPRASIYLISLSPFAPVSVSLWPPGDSLCRSSSLLSLWPFTSMGDPLSPIIPVSVSLSPFVPLCSPVRFLSLSLLFLCWK